MIANDAWLAPASDAHFLNAIANHSSVRPFMGGPEGFLDLGRWVADPKTHVLIGAHGFSIFHQLAYGLYDWHCGVLPEGRGRWALNAGKASLDYAFERISALAIIAAIPQPNRGARVLVSALGFKLRHVLPEAFPTPAGNVALYVYVMLRAD
jgi:RimJ/RimL family protein N-acetyltransferase